MKSDITTSHLTRFSASLRCYSNKGRFFLLEKTRIQNEFISLFCLATQAHGDHFDETVLWRCPGWRSKAKKTPFLSFLPLSVTVNLLPLVFSRKSAIWPFSLSSPYTCDICCSLLSFFARLSVHLKSWMAPLLRDESYLLSPGVLLASKGQYILQYANSDQYSGVHKAVHSLI